MSMTTGTITDFDVEDMRSKQHVSTNVHSTFGHLEDYTQNNITTTNFDSQTWLSERH